MKFIDFYKVIGVERTASQSEIKRAYHRLARRYHPDLNPSNEVSLTKFTIINQAYTTLGDLDNRLKYKIKLEKHDDIKEKMKYTVKAKKL